MTRENLTLHEDRVTLMLNDLVQIAIASWSAIIGPLQ